MKNLLKIRVDEFKEKTFMRDILNYCKKELSSEDILWWIEGKEDDDILKFNLEDCLEEQFVDYIKVEGNKLNIPLFIHGNMKTYEVININGEFFYIDIAREEEASTIGIEIENINGNFIISTEETINRENMKYIEEKYKVA